MLVKHETVVMYRELARVWDERARRASTEQSRETCVELADAYRSLVSVLAGEAARPPLERAG